MSWPTWFSQLMSNSQTLRMKRRSRVAASRRLYLEELEDRWVPTSVTSISPSSGSTLGGTFVTILGTDFTGTTSVKFGASNSSFFIVDSDTSIRAQSPAQGAGVVDVVVTSPAGTSPVTPADQFTYVAPPVPTVTSISPATGSTLGGTFITILGSGFTGGSASVKFGTSNASFVNVISDTEIRASSPAQGAGVVDVVVTTAGGTSAATVAGQFTYVAPPIPTVASISPATGSTLGGTFVTILGTGFTGGSASVKFGTSNASFVSVISDTEIRASSPAQGPGVVDVVVTTAGGASAVSAADKFTYVAPPVPTVASISPASGPPLGGTFVTILGTGFMGGNASVKFGTSSASFVNVISDTEIRVSSPAQGPGIVDVVVTTAGGSSAITAAGKFAYVTPVVPSVTSISPASGPTTSGTTVTILGTGFTGATGVKFGTSNASFFIVNSDTQITVTSPLQGPGVVDVTVTGPGGTSPIVAADKFTYVTPATPSITSISPATGPTTGSTTVTILGTGFTNATTVKFGTSNASFFIVNSDTQITVTSPAQGAGIVDVTVTGPGGTSPVVAADKFTYVASLVPTITGLTPASGLPAGGTTVTISGANFAGATAVTFGGVAATSFTVVNATTITAVTPARAAGVVNVAVTTANGTSTASGVSQYTYTAVPAPTVTSISPSTGVLVGGATITITGLNFTGTTSVTIGGVVVTSFTVINATTITAIVPAHPAGTVDVIVITAGGSSPVTAASQFTYSTVLVPTVTAISPASGVLVGGTTITITGTNFTGATSITIGGVAVTSFTVINSTTITVVVPARGAGTFDVIVVTPGGASAVTSASRFTYSDVPAPTVTGLSPAVGPLAGGGTITITGTGFTGATSVSFGGVLATNVVVVNATTITVTVPAHAVGVVDVIVTTPGGPSGIVIACQFTYAAIPTVAAVSPNKGTTTGGTVITLTGTGFTGATAVTIGGVATNFTFVNDTTITTTTPAHAAGTVDVVVTTLGGSSAISASTRFTYDGTGPTVTISVPSAAIVSTGSVTYTVVYTDATFNASTLTAADVTLNRTGTANGTVSVNPGTGSTRTVTISGITGSGTLGISLAAGTASDTLGNLAPAAGPSATFTVDSVARLAVGDATGTVRLLNSATGDVVSAIRPLDTVDALYNGLVQVALGDFNGDGIADLAVSAANPVGVAGLDVSKAGKVFVYDGASLATQVLSLIATYTPFTNHSGPDGSTGDYTNGLNIATGDVNGDGQIDLIAGTRGGSAVAGRPEFGRLVVIDGATSAIIGGVQTPFGAGYQKGVVVATGNVDGVGGDEIAVTRGGPVASPNPAVQQIKVKVLQLQGADLAELRLAADGATAFAPFGTLPGAANAINRDGRVALVDTNGDGRDELVFTALDPLTDPANGQVRVGVYTIDPTVSAAAATIVSTGSDQATYLSGAGVVDHAITHLATPGQPQRLALMVQSETTLNVLYLAPDSGATQGSIALTLSTGGITIDGI